MIKKIFLCLCLTLATLAFSQEGTSSPYSFYGIGDLKFKGTVDNRSMGGVSVFPDSIHLNIQNPASYASLKYIAFSLGANYNTTKFKTNAQQEDAKRSALDYIALGIPTGKLSFAAGLMPVSSVGYQITSIASTTEERRFQGSGGLNKFFIGAAYKINKNFSVGLDIGYNFGLIKTEGLLFSSQAYYGSRESNTSRISGFDANFGAMYSRPITKKLNLYTSLVFSPMASLESQNARNIATILFSNATGALVVDQVDVAVVNNTIKMPTKIALGAGVGQTKKWALGAEFTFQQFSSFSNRFVDITRGSFENAKRIAVGGYYIPKYNSFTNYLEKINYRAGFRYENTGLVINNKSISDAAVTAGLGFPVAGLLSNINFGFEYGKRGTKAAGLVEENYMIFTVGLSLSDRWFVKRKYD
jgi:long-subunit fatty acid transport protein